MCLFTPCLEGKLWRHTTHWNSVLCCRKELVALAPFAGSWTVFVWFCREVFKANAFPHRSHLWGLVLSSWKLSMWLFSSSEDKNTFRHRLHWDRPFPLWTLWMCNKRLRLSENSVALSHCLQTNVGVSPNTVTVRSRWAVVMCLKSRIASSNS